MKTNEPRPIYWRDLWLCSAIAVLVAMGAWAFDFVMWLYLSHQERYIQFVLFSILMMAGGLVFGKAGREK